LRIESALHALRPRARNRPDISERGACPTLLS